MLRFPSLVVQSESKRRGDKTVTLERQHLGYDFDTNRYRVEIIGAGGGGRTLMTSEGRGILSPVRLPVPPLQQVLASLEFIRL